MDANLFAESIQYEQLTQSIYQAILEKEGINNIQVEHNVNITGKSGIKHQIDVFWKFKQAGIEHKVLIECRNYNSSITLEKIGAFHSVVSDINNAKGLMITKVGYQSGAEGFAQFNGIGLKILRKPTDEDWEGRVKDFHITIVAKSVVSTKEYPLNVHICVASDGDEQKKRIEKLIKENNFITPPPPLVCFRDKNGNIISEEMRYWLPKKLDVIEKDGKGPHKQRIELEDKYILANEGLDNQELVRVSILDIEYYIESFSIESVIHGEDVVDVILKDYVTKDTEYVKNKEF